MNNFRITDILSTNIIEVAPKWEFPNKDGSVITGNRIKIRELDASDQQDLIKKRLRKLLIGNDNQISFNAPELINTDSHSDAIVSCSVYISHTNITYYFPEFVTKY